MRCIGRSEFSNREVLFLSVLNYQHLKEAGSCFEPLSQKEVIRLMENSEEKITQSTVSKLFKKFFKGMKRYKQLCCSRRIVYHLELEHINRLEIPFSQLRDLIIELIKDEREE